HSPLSLTSTLSLHDALPILAKIMRRAYRGELVEITPRSAANRFHVTPEHPVLTIRRARVSRGDRGPGRWADIDPWRLESAEPELDRKSTRLNSSHRTISYAV